MKKKLKILNIFFFLIIIVSVFAFTNTETMAQDVAPPTAASVPVVSTAVPVPVAEGNNVTIPKTIPEKNAYTLAHIGKAGVKYKIFKFFTAMFGVLVSILAIFFGLKIYKKIMLKNNQKLDNIDYDRTLESPKDFKEAINLFLDKTDKF